MYTLCISILAPFLYTGCIHDFLYTKCIQISKIWVWPGMCTKYIHGSKLYIYRLVVILLSVMVMYNDTVKDSTMDLEDNTWELFKHVRDFALKIIQWKSNCHFFETCIREHLRIKGLRVKDNRSFNDPELRFRCREHYLLAERKVTHENYEFAKKRKEKKCTKNFTYGKRNCLKLLNSTRARIGGMQ